jgi:hypothetical protein
MRGTRGRLGLGATAAALALGLVPSSTMAASSGDQLWLDFEATTPGHTITSLANVGSATVAVTVVTAHGGRLRARHVKTVGSRVADYPAYDGRADGPRAVVSVLPVGSDDPLEPLGASFRFGVDARLDAKSQGTSADDGNNLIQRGLFSDGAQFKIQEDSRTLSCRVQGQSGALMVVSKVRPRAKAWYRIRCARNVVSGGDRLVIAVRTIRGPGSLGPVTKTWSPTGQVGVLDFAPSTPLSVGGKLTGPTAVHPASDQFNGMLDNAFVHVS